MRKLVLLVILPMLSAAAGAVIVIKIRNDNERINKLEEVNTEYKLRYQTLTQVITAMGERNDSLKAELNYCRIQSLLSK